MVARTRRRIGCACGAHRSMYSSIVFDARRRRAMPVVTTSASSCCLDGGDVDLLHRHHRLEGALGLIAASRKCVGERARGDLPGEAPAVLAPPARTFPAAVADDGVPVAVRLLLIVRRDLEGKGLAVLERRAAVETEAGNAQDGELHRQHVALFAARIVAGCLVNSGHFTIWKRGGVEARRFMRVLVEPQADRVLWLHRRVLLVLGTSSRPISHWRRYYSGRSASSASWIATMANCHPALVPCNKYTTPARSSSCPSVFRRTAEHQTVIAGGVAVRRKTDGQKLERAGVVYLLQGTSAGWQFAMVAIHDAEDALRPE